MCYGVFILSRTETETGTATGIRTSGRQYVWFRCYVVDPETPRIRISLCIQNQIFDGVGRSSDPIHRQWMVLEDFPIQTSIKSDFGWCQKVFRHHPLAMDGVRRPSNAIKNPILMHKPIQIHSGFFLHTLCESIHTVSYNPFVPNPCPGLGSCQWNIPLQPCPKVKNGFYL